MFILKVVGIGISVQDIAMTIIVFQENTMFKGENIGKVCW